MLLGRSVLHYQVESQLGAGGMGVVYKAIDTKLRRPVALKFLHTGIVTDERQRQRFLREATTASSLDHPNICTIYEINETPEGQLFIAMAYYPGETLHQVLRRGPLTPELSFEVALQLGCALEHAHAAGVIHRDIKPGNIMIHTGRVKVLDFGIAKLKDEGRLTGTGVSMGTPQYMAPEQLRGQDVDHRADIWASGAVLFEMLTGTLPFAGSNFESIVHAVLSRPTPSAKARLPHLPPDIDSVIGKALAKRRADRYGHISELITDLEALRGDRKPIVATARVQVAASSPAIAVLPFQNFSSDPEYEYFVDGLTEDLTTALARLPMLRVVSRSSAFEFKGKAQDIPRIGEVLNVDSILEGSVRKAGNRIRINAKLVDVASGFQIWSERYDREVTDIFAVQDEISSSIVDALRLTIPTGAMAAYQPHRNENLEAYELYLKGRFHWNRKNPEGLEKAREYFEQALQVDSNYAPSHAGLANYYSVVASYGLAPPAEMWPKARAAAERALELDPNLADPYAILACVLDFYSRDWAAGEAQLQTALRLRPQYAEAHLYYCYHFLVIGNLGNAMEQARRALAADPLSQGANAAVALVLLYSGDYTAAIQRCKQGLDLDPNFVEFHYTLGLAYQGQGKHDEAVAAFERGADVTGRMPLLLGWLAAAYAQAGRRSDAQRVLKELLDLWRQGAPVPLPIAVAYTGLGDKDKAFEWLNRSADAYDTVLCYLQVVPTYEILRHDRRYGELLMRLGLSPFAPTLVTRRVETASAEQQPTAFPSINRGPVD